MSAPDKVLVYTIRDPHTLACPLCPFTLDVPPIPVSDAIGEALGMSGDSLARVHAEQVAKRAVGDMRFHLNGHTLEEWLAAVVPNGVAARSGS